MLKIKYHASFKKDYKKVVILQAVESVILHRTGFLSMKLIMEN